MTKLHIAEDTTIDLLKLVDSRMLITANSGGGKSYLLRVVAEQAAGKVQTIILDPEGEFSTLREKFEFLLVGEAGEIATETRSAALLARKLLELEASAVIDMSSLPLPERRRFVRLFLDSLLSLPKTLWHPLIVMLDESHLFAPERSAGEAESTNAVINLMSLGRKRSYCAILATQRLSKLHKDAEAETNNVFIGRTWLDLDQARAGKLLGIQKKEELQLRDLPPGTFHAFGPALSKDGVNQIVANRSETTHPKAGQRHKLTPPKPSEAVKRIAADLADLPQQAEAEVRDMAEATRKIAELEKKLRERPKEMVPAEPKIEYVEVPVLKNGQLDKANRLVDRMCGLMNDAREIYGPLANEIAKATAPSIKITTPINIKPAPNKAAKAYEHTEFERIFEGNGDFKINKAQQRILDALAWFESLGNISPTNIQVGAVALLDATGGHFSNTVGPLSTGGLIIRGDGTIQLTDAGRAAAKPIENPGTLSGYHDVLRSRVRKMKSASGKTIDMLDVIIKADGLEVTTELIGQAVGIDHSGGHFSNTIGPLGTVGLIKRNRGVVTPTNILFPPGLR